jgi:hypothetical protein
MRAGVISQTLHFKPLDKGILCINPISTIAVRKKNNNNKSPLTLTLNPKS